MCGGRSSQPAGVVPIQSDGYEVIKSDYKVNLMITDIAVRHDCSKRQVSVALTGNRAGGVEDRRGGRSLEVRGRIVAVTGAGSGIGRALCLALAREGARQVAAIDINQTHANAVANDCGGEAYRCDVTDENALAQTLERIEREQGAIDLFCSNAGIARMDAVKGEAASAPNRDWEASWQVNVMQHIYAARVLVPKMRARGGGRFLITASAAGLLTQLGGAPYAVTKHAAIGFAEMLAITHAKDGIGVSVLCPQGVETPLLQSIPAGPERVDGVLSPEAVATATIEGLRREAFLILPHENVRRYMHAKAADYDRWLRGMIKLGQRLDEGSGP